MSEQRVKADTITLRRRSVLTGVVKLFAIFGLGFAAIPFVKSLIPEFDEDLTKEIDIASLKASESMLVEWRGRRIIIYRRDVQVLNDLAITAEGVLKDPVSKESEQPAFALNPFRSLRPEILVVYSNCTHLGCEIAVSDSQANNKVGFECPCHQSEYDHSGRVLSDQAAPYNLEVPNYTFVSGEIIRLLPEEKA